MSMSNEFIVLMDVEGVMEDLLPCVVGIHKVDIPKDN